MWELVGQLIFEGAIERIALQATEAHGAALLSNVRRIVNQYYPNTVAGTRESLARYAYESIRAARNYDRQGADYRPFVGTLPDPRAAIGYAANVGGVDLGLGRSQVQYSFTVTTVNTDRVTGAETLRENIISVFSDRPLTRREALEQAAIQANQAILFDWKTDPQNIQRVEELRFNAVFMGIG